MTPIRAIIGRFIYPYSFAAMEKVLAKRPFEYLGILAHPVEPRKFKGVPESQQEWFDAGAIRSCQYANVDWSTLRPIDEELIESMRTCEAMFMEIVARQEWKYAIPFSTRKRWYLRHLQFWNDYLLRNSINLYLSAWIPHELPDVIIYWLCKHHNIAVVYFHMSTERDTAFLEHDFYETAIQISPRYEELLKEFAGVTDPAKIPVPPHIEERFAALTAPRGQKPPLASVHNPTYVDHLRDLLWKKPLAFFSYGLQYLTPSGLKRATSTIQRWHDIRQRNAFYDAHAIEPDLTQPFIYLALHFQPEASTVPMGGAYADQVLMARALHAFLPKGTLIYVKEHPRESSWNARSIQYYKDFLEIPSVRLIARHVDTFALSDRCAAIATATGSVGFEGIFRGKPVFMFGHRFYQYARGVFCIRTNEDLQKAVDDVFKNGAKPTLVTSKLYLKAMDDTRVKGTLVPWDRQVSHMTDEEHAESYCGAILGELERRGGRLGLYDEENRI